MDTKSKFLISLFLVLVVGVSVWKYYTLMIARDFIVNTRILCEPSLNSCFTAGCDVESGEDCTNEVYAKLTKSASNIPMCNKFIEQCPELGCEPNESLCKITYCSKETAEDGESCVSSSVSQLDMESKISNEK